MKLDYFRIYKILYSSFIILFTLNLNLIKAQEQIPDTENENFNDEIKIQGKIYNEFTKEPLPFVNMIIENTLTGTATDEEGNFTLSFPNYYSEFKLYVSAIGFTAESFDLNELKKVEGIIIELKPINYEIVAIDIKGESKILYGMIRQAVNGITQNYINRPYKYNFNYKNTYIAGATSQVTTSSGYILDSKGYFKQKSKDLFNSQTYKFTKTERNYQAAPFKAGSTNMDELLEYDVVRSRTGILNEEYLYEYQLELVESTPYNGDTLVQIAFKNLNPNLVNTHDAYIKYSEGDIYILKNKNVILKFVLRGSSEKKSIHGKSFFTKNSSDLFATDVRYTLTANYHTNGKAYHLNSINVNEEFITPDKLKGKRISQLIIPDHEVLSTPPEINNRDFYNRPQGF